MKTLLITGGIGSGKTIVCDYLRAKGYPVYDSDKRTKELYDEEPSLLDSIEEAFGESFRDEAGKLDRKKLSSVIFSDPQKKKILEDIVYPVVKEDFIVWRCGIEQDLVAMESAVAMDNPLFSDLFDARVLVSSPLQERLKRVEARDNASESEVMQRVKTQNYQEGEADYVIDNSSDLKALQSKVNELINKYI